MAFSFYSETEGKVRRAMCGRAEGALTFFEGAPFSMRVEFYRPTFAGVKSDSGRQQ
jgi:hypothetical protein